MTRHVVLDHQAHLCRVSIKLQISDVLDNQGLGSRPRNLAVCSTQVLLLFIALVILFVYEVLP